MQNLHALRLTSRPGCKDGVGQIVGVRIYGVLLTGY